MTLTADSGGPKMSDTGAEREAEAAFTIEPPTHGGHEIIRFTGRWTIESVVRDRAAVRRYCHERMAQAATPIDIDLSGVTGLDTYGAFMMRRLRDDLRRSGAHADFTGTPNNYAVMLERVCALARDDAPDPPKNTAFVNLLIRTGKAAREIANEAADMLRFLGLVMRVLGLVIVQPRRLRVKSVVNQMEQTGINSLPIVGLLSGLIGLVMAYQSAEQLRLFGAEILVVNIITISALRELGVLLTAIILAGRSGSAFTAQIGTMKVNQEVDALRTMGLNTIEILVIPRVLALVFTLPFVGVYAALAAILGGMIACDVLLDIPPSLFLTQMREAVTVSSLYVTLIKAPVFAFAIAFVGCYQGLKVTGSAESVGLLTTRSVVVSIFLVILLDALFSIFFSFVGL